MRSGIRYQVSGIRGRRFTDCNLRFTLFLLLLSASFALADSTFFDDQDDFFIMGDFVSAPVVTPVGGGGGYTAPECENDSGCELGEFCFESKCYVYECDSDSDCNDTKTCWMNRCVKLFDMKIIEVESPIYPGEFFNFTYYLKGVAAIHGDVIVKFWLVQDGEIVTEGFDTIYFADFEEKTETSELFLPGTILPGTYNFYAEVEYDSYYARAGRIIEVEEAAEEAVVEERLPITGGVIEQIGEGVRENFLAILIILGILILALIVYWERRKIKKAWVEDEKWLKRYRVSIAAAALFVVLAGIVCSLVDVIFLKNSFVNVYRGILFLIKNYYVYFLLIIAVVLIAYIYKKKKKDWKASRFGKKFLRFFESARKGRGKKKLSKLKGEWAKEIKPKRIEIEEEAVEEEGWRKVFGFFGEKVNRTYLFLLKSFGGFRDAIFGYFKNVNMRWDAMRRKREEIEKIRLKEAEREGEVRALEIRKLEKAKEKDRLAKIKDRKVMLERTEKSVLRFKKNLFRSFAEKKREWSVAVREMKSARRAKLREKNERGRIEALERRRLEKVRQREMMLKEKRKEIAWTEFRKGFLNFKESLFDGIRRKKQEWDVDLKKMKRARVIELREKKRRVRAEELKKVKEERENVLRAKRVEKDRKRERLLKIRQRRVRREKFRKDVVLFFREVRENVGGVWNSFSNKVKRRKKILKEKFRRYEEVRRLKRIRAEKLRRDKELGRMNEAKRKALLEKRIKRERQERDFARIKEERRRMELLRSQKIRERNRGMRLLAAMKSGMKGHKEKLAELERIKRRVERIEEIEGSRKSSFDFSGNVKINRSRIKSLASKSFGKVREAGKSFFNLLRKGAEGQGGSFIVSKPKFSSVVRDGSAKKSDLESRSRFKPLVSSSKGVQNVGVKKKLPFLKLKFRDTSDEPSAFALALESRLKFEREKGLGSDFKKLESEDDSDLKSKE